MWKDDNCQGAPREALPRAFPPTGFILLLFLTIPVVTWLYYYSKQLFYLWKQILIFLKYRHIIHEINHHGKPDSMVIISVMNSMTDDTSMSPGTILGPRIWNFFFESPVCPLSHNLHYKPMELGPSLAGQAASSQPPWFASFVLSMQYLGEFRGLLLTKRQGIKNQGKRPNLGEPPPLYALSGRPPLKIKTP